MDEYDHPDNHAGNEIGLTTILTIFAAALSLFICLMSLSEMAQVGPDVGAIVSFDPRNGPRDWSQPGILAAFVPESDRTRTNCLLMPSVMASDGGSLVIEAKEMTRPPLFHVHWSGPRTAVGARDCGKSADLTLQLIQLRALANVAGGFGPVPVWSLF